MIKSIKSVNVANRRVLLRAGFDVPLKLNPHLETLEVADDSRIKDCLPTIKYLIASNAKVVIISHLGRPDGKWDNDKSLWPVAQDLGRLIGYKTVLVDARLPNYNIPHVYFLKSDILKKDYSKLSSQIKPGDILFLENLRFYEQEEANDSKFVSILGKFGDIYVNDAFSVAHRKEGSTFGLAQALPAYAGLSFIKEIESLGKILRKPTSPFIVVMGGVKISDKIDTIKFLARNAQHILVGGGIANSMLAAVGYEIGKSKATDIEEAKHLWRNFKDKIVLPKDVVVAKSPEDRCRVVARSKVLKSDIIYDIGPQTIREFASIIRNAKTLVWNGPMGLIEVPKFSFGSKSLAQMFGARAKGKAYGVVGGGETAEVVDKAKVGQYIDHVSTGGGAMLEFLSGKTLPAIKALEHA